MFSRENIQRGTVDGGWQQVEAMLALRRQARYGTKKDGRVVRDYMKDYYNSASCSVNWQDNMVERARGWFYFQHIKPTKCLHKNANVL